MVRCEDIVGQHELAPPQSGHDLDFLGAALVVETSRRAVPAELDQRDRRAPAVLLHERAARMEAAAGGRRREVRRRAGDRRELLAHDVEVGHRAEQPERVRMTRLTEHRLDRSRLDHLTRVHHRDIAARLRDHGEIV